MVRAFDAQRRLRVGQRKLEPELREERSEISGPTHRHSRSAEQILEDQVPSDDPRDELTQRRVAVRVRASGDRNHRREFGVTQPREQTANAGQDERQDDGRAGILSRRCACEDEDAGAYDGADAERREIERAERALQRVLSLSRRFLLQEGNALGRQQAHWILRGKRTCCIQLRNT